MGVGVDDARARLQLDGKWSIAQNIGHLSDVEELWQERLEDLKNGRKTYTPAVPSRFQELAKRHQERPVAEILRELRVRRSRLVDALDQASPELSKAEDHGWCRRMKAAVIDRYGSNAVSASSV